MWSFFKLFLLSYFILIPIFSGLVARWFFGLLSVSLGDVAGWVVGLGTFVVVVLGAILRVTAVFRD